MHKMILKGEIKVLGGRPGPVPLCLPQIPSSNLRFRSETPAINCLNHSMAWSGRNLWRLQRNLLLHHQIVEENALLKFMLT